MKEIVDAMASRLARNLKEFPSSTHRDAIFIGAQVIQRYISRKAFDFLSSEQRPSTWTGDYWIRVHSPQERKKLEDPRQRKMLIKQLREGKVKSGKWLIFVNRENVDKVWEKIRTATEAGKLGTSAKVSTPLQGGKSHVICVYTEDWTDEADVRRVREELKRLGITNKIPYKTDEDTLKGRYAFKGHKRIAKYWA